MKKLTILLTILILAGCKPTTDVTNTKGTGTSKEFNHAYDVVWDTAVSIVDESKLDLLASDKEEGKIFGRTEMSAFSYGESVAVFITAKGENLTEVEVVSKRNLSINFTAKNWTKPIFESLEEQLK